MAALPQPASDFFLQGRVPEGDVFALDASSGQGGGGPFLSPFSIPAECLGSQQRVTLALVPQEKGRGYLFESAGPTASRTDSALPQRGVPRDRRAGLGGASLLLQVWEP